MVDGFATAAPAELEVMRAERTHAVMARSRDDRAAIQYMASLNEHPGTPGEERRMAADVGAKAPDFTLMNQDRQPVTLSEQVNTRYNSRLG